MHKLFLKGLSFLLIFSVFFTFSAAPALAAVSYIYDANGNMTSDGTDCYHYNEANQMDKVTKCANGQTIAEYIYDYTGMRLVKKEFENGVLKKTIYSPADEYETVKQATSGATANTTYYKANDELIAKKNPDGSITYYHNDHLGSSAVLSDQTGTVVEKTSYEPYGEVKSGGTKSKFGYTGQEQDNETSLNYYDSRYYDPHIQRFIQPDTWLPDIFDPQQLNRYSYANNNPLKYTDPSGHNAQAVALAGTGLLFLGGIGAALASIPVIPIIATVALAAVIYGTWQYSQSLKKENSPPPPQNNNNNNNGKTGGGTTGGSTGGGNTGGGSTGGGTTGGSTGGGNTGGNTGGGDPRIPNPADLGGPAIPIAAYDTLQKIRGNGLKPLEGYFNRIYKNVTNPFLPDKPLGTYLEHDVLPAATRADRNFGRVVIDTLTGQSWYTYHYLDGFIPFAK